MTGHQNLVAVHKSDLGCTDRVNICSCTVIIIAHIQGNHHTFALGSGGLFFLALREAKHQGHGHHKIGHSSHGLILLLFKCNIAEAKTHQNSDAAAKGRGFGFGEIGIGETFNTFRNGAARALRVHHSMILVAVVLVGVLQQPTVNLGVQCGWRHQGCQPERKHEGFQSRFFSFHF